MYEFSRYVHTQVLTFMKKRKFSRSSTYNLDSPWALLQICYLILFSPFFCLPTIMYVFTVYFHEFFCCNQFTKNVLSFKNFRTLVKLTFTFRIFDDEKNQQFIGTFENSIGIPKIQTNKIENTTSDYKDKLTI